MKRAKMTVQSQYKTREDLIEFVGQITFVNGVNSITFAM
jgi:hypothetical protein